MIRKARCGIAVAVALLVAWAAGAQTVDPGEAMWRTDGTSVVAGPATGFYHNSIAAGLTASTTQTQGQGPLTAQINEISIVANDGDVRTLPTAVGGRMVTIINNGANDLQLFPFSGDNLGAGVDASVELKPNQSVDFVAYDATNWHVESFTGVVHAEIHDEGNTDAYVISDSGGDFHAYHTNGLVAGDLSGWTFDAGGAGTSFPIASIVDSPGSPGSQILVTTTGSHGLAPGDVISQTNLSDAAYGGLFDVVATASAATYEVAAVFTADGTGTMDQAATLTCSEGFSGDYFIQWWASATSAANNETFDFGLALESTGIAGAEIRRKFGNANDFGAFSGGAVISVAAGEKISWCLSNSDSAGNITVRGFTIVLLRL